MSEACPVCGFGEPQVFLTLPDVPVHCNVLCASREEALGAPRASIELAACERCSHVFNRAFDASRLAYSGHYENSLFYSPTFRAYAEDLARRLVKRHHLIGKTVVEIGAGDGRFLQLLCGSGKNRGIAFDPSGAILNATAGDGITVIRDYYDERYASCAGDLVCCRQVLEHVEDPVGFLRKVRKSVEGTPRAAVFFEVPNGRDILAEGRIWDLIYEHYSYFTAASLVWAFRSAGFDAACAEESFGGQYLCIEGRPAADQPPPQPGNGCRDASRYGEAARRKLESWRSRMPDGRPAALWGAGSKGVMFLNLAGMDRGVAAVVDVNPRKHGKFVAGTGHRIEPPEALRERPCGVVLLANSIYREEVAGMLRALDLAPELVCL